MQQSVLLYQSVGDTYGRIELVDHMGSDLAIIQAARVSFAQDLSNGDHASEYQWRPDKDPKLLRYLIKHQHWSPFECATLKWHIVVPLFVARQWHRHRTWCLASDAELEFVRPVDGKSYRVRIDRLEASWNPPAAKRRRKDQSPLSLQEHNRKRIQSMQLRCRGPNGEIETTRITDIWRSGVKKVYEIRVGKHRIRASADHLFHSEGEWRPVKDLEGRNVTLLGRAGNVTHEPTSPIFSDKELDGERWVEFIEGYRVSSLGRVQSRLRSGSKILGTEWRDRTIVFSTARRAVVFVHNKTMQVSRLVADAFDLPGEGDWVLHIDDDPLNNRRENLYRGDAVANMRDQERNGGRQRRAWVSLPVDEIIECGEQQVYDVAVAHEEHCFVANKFLVHNCYNEISRRYTSEDLRFYLPHGLRAQASKNKQASTWDDLINPLVQFYALRDEPSIHATDALAKMTAEAERVYNLLLDAGVAREHARMVLPQNMYTRFYGTVNLRNALAFIKLRYDNHAQWEIYEAAKAMRYHLSHLFPETMDAWHDLQEEK